MESLPAGKLILCRPLSSSPVYRVIQQAHGCWKIDCLCGVAGELSSVRWLVLNSVTRTDWIYQLSLWM